MIHKEFNYTVIIEKDSESGDYTASVPSFDGCVVQMKTYDQALKEIREVLKDFINEYIKDGLKLPQVSKRIVSVPRHGKTIIRRGTLKMILKGAGKTLEELKIELKK